VSLRSFARQLDRRQPALRLRRSRTTCRRPRDRVHARKLGVGRMVRQSGHRRAAGGDRADGAHGLGDLRLRQPDRRRDFGADVARLQSRADGEREMIHGDPLWWILNEEFSPRWNAANGWEYLVMGLLLHGDGIAIISARPASTSARSMASSRSIRSRQRASDARLQAPGLCDPAAVGRARGLRPGRHLHVPGFGFNGYRGLSPLRNHLRMTGSVALATQEFAARFFANGARPDVVLKSDQKRSRPSRRPLIRDRGRAAQRPAECAPARRPGQGVRRQAAVASARGCAAARDSALLG
jgi:hypothetical protein